MLIVHEEGNYEKATWNRSVLRRRLNNVSNRTALKEEERVLHASVAAATGNAQKDICLFLYIQLI